MTAQADKPLETGAPAQTRATFWWRRLLAIVTGYRGEKLALRAGNLTFITITSLVPMAAVALSLVHVFDQGRIDSLIMRFFEDVLSPGGRAQSEATIRKFLVAGKSRTAGGVSFTFLLISAGILLRHLDASLNELWDVRRPRPMLWSLGLYAGVLLVGPLLMALGLVGSENLRHLIQWLDLPFSGQALALGAIFAAVGLFTLLYKLAPHSHVSWAAAFKGGLAAGVAWELARRLYASIAGLFFSANPLFGSLGIAPLFLMWIYVGWYIVLSGARLAYAFEHADFHHGFRDLLDHPRSNELIAARIAGRIARAQLTNAPPPSVRTLAKELELPAQRVADLVFRLERAGLLIASKGQLHAASAIASLTLADVSAAVGGTAKLLQNERRIPAGAFGVMADLFSEMDTASVDKLRKITWETLAEGEGAPPRKP